MLMHVYYARAEVGANIFGGSCWDGFVKKQGGER